MLIISKEDFDLVEQNYALAKVEQAKRWYRIKKWLNESMLLGRFLCCCLKVQDEVDIPWERMNPMQRKHRIKKLWKKSKRVLFYQKFNLGGDGPKKQEVFEEDQDLLDNIN